MLNTIKVTYKSTNNILKANKFLQEISASPVIACDFEVASRYYNEDLIEFNNILDSTESTHLQKMEAKSKLNSDALGHPSHTTLTHLSVAANESEAYVFILDSVPIIERILNFLTTTTQLQIWHNASFDFKHVHYYMNKFPINYEDTQIYTKTLINHVEVHKATTGLKELAGHAYGGWGISSDNFTIEQMYEPHILLYAGTDACATMWIWNRIQESTECPILPEHVATITKHVYSEYEFEEPSYIDEWQSFDSLVSDNYPDGLYVNIRTSDDTNHPEHIRLFIYRSKLNPTNNLYEADQSEGELHIIDIRNLYDQTMQTPNQ